MTTADVLIDVDSRGRTNLSKFSKGARFLGRQEEDGTIILEPARIVTAAEDRLRRNPHTVEKLEKAHANIDNAVKLDLVEG
jgi:hypothetical protein